MDVTFCTNCQNKPLFLMVVKDANGETHVGNISVLPSEKAVVELQENFRSKESKLANYIQSDCRNCMDVITTSWVESCNHAVKKGSFSVHFNMTLDTTCAKVLESVESQIQC